MRIFGLIGYPLEHSASPVIFSQIFGEAGLRDCKYSLFPLREIGGLPGLLKKYPGIKGLNVTIPHKESVLPFLNKLDNIAREIGAVNVIQIINCAGKTSLTGYNTDYYGFYSSFQKFVKAPTGLKALILGSGGSSRVVQYTLAEMNIPFRLVSRKAGRDVISYSSLDEEIITSHKIIINTTPAGMYPYIDLFPLIPYNYIGREHYLFDLIYNPAETLFLQMGRERGARVKNGLEMLHIQAEKAWEIWNNC